LIKKIKIAGNNPQIRQWLYYVMISRPPSLPKNEEKYREEIPDRVERRVARAGMGENHAPSDKRNIAEELDLNKKPNRDSHVSRYRGNTMDTNGRTRQGPNKQMSRCTRIIKQKTEKAERDQGQTYQ